MKAGEIIGSILETIIKLAIFIFLGVLIYRGALMAYDYGYRVFTEAPVSVGEGRIISIEVKEDMSSRELGDMLQQKGLIRDSKIFFLQELLSEYHGKETPGIYDLSTAMTAEEMLAVMSKDFDDSSRPLDSRGFNFKLIPPSSYGSSAPQLPIIRVVCQSEISLWNALKQVCECSYYKFIVRDTIIVVMPID